MSKLFRQVSVKDRLPEKPGVYNTDLGKLEFSTNPCYKNNGIWLKENYVNNPEIWLEEIELPNYEDTRKARDAYSYSYLDPFRWGWKYGVKHILSMLKVEKNV